MASKGEVIQQVRFALGQLKARNGHHEFEELCRHLARQIILPNILPATGPVSAGGDQGRDFESFQTWVEREVSSAFVGVAPDGEPVAFTCTLQSVGLDAKIESDVDHIMSSGSSVKWIFAFTEKDVPVARRHALQKKVRDKHSVELEVLDGTALSELLAERDTFWISQSFLNLPAEIYPRPSDEAEWYVAALAKWKSATATALTHGVFSEVKAGIRHATQSGPPADIAFWIEQMSKFLSAEAHPRLRRAARYEITVAQLRGLGTLIGQETLVREFLDGAAGLDDVIELSDSAVLLMFCLGAKQRGLLDLSADELFSWNEAISERLKRILEEERSRGERAISMQVLGYLNIQPDLRRTPPESVNANEAVDWWLAAVEQAREAPVFPVGTLSDQISEVAPLLAQSPRYDELVQGIDQLVAERMGQSAVAEKCRDRAMAFVESEQLLAALRELHQAKVDWFGGDTLRGSLLAMLTIARIYQSLGLPLAAKYHYMATAYGAMSSGDTTLLDLASAGLLGAADMDYATGAWFAYLRGLRIALRSHFEFSDSDDPFSDEEVLASMFHLAVIRTVAELHRPEAADSLNPLVDEFGLKEAVAQVAATGRTVWESRSEQDFVDGARDQLFDRPFSDGGERRTIRWRALGVSWSAEFANECRVTEAAERLVAMLQVLLADLAAHDLAVIPTTVNIRVTALEGASPDARFVIEEGRTYCEVTLPLLDDTLTVEETTIQALTLGMALLLHVSILPHDEVRDAVEDAFRGGITHKIAPAAIYDTLVEAFAPCADDFAGRAATAPLGDSFDSELTNHPELAWRTGPGPKYTAEEATLSIGTRYERFSQMLLVTLPNLAADPEFQAKVETYRTEGWLDWHILGAVGNVAVNARSGSLSGMTPEQMELIRTSGPPIEQPGDAPVPRELFTDQGLRMFREIYALTTLKTWGLVCRQEAPDAAAIIRLLTERYGFMSDDAPHSNLF